MASLTQWTWVWVNSGSWWWTGRSGMLQSMGSQRVKHDWATELNWVLLDSCNPMNCSPPGSSVDGILQARILEWVAFSFFRGTSQPRNWTQAFPAWQADAQSPWLSSMGKPNIFVQIHRMNIKSELYCKLWTLGDTNVSMWIIGYNKCTICWGTLKWGREAWRIWEISLLSWKFCCELKTSLKNKVLKKNPKSGHWGSSDTQPQLTSHLSLWPPLPHLTQSLGLFIPRMHSDIRPPGKVVWFSDAFTLLTERTDLINVADRLGEESKVGGENLFLAISGNLCTGHR